MNTIIRNVTVVNEGEQAVKDVLIKGERIEQISSTSIDNPSNYKEINGEGLHLIPGMIDDQVHFREPGLTHKANIYTESRAAVAGGITSFMEMPNTKPQSLTQELLEDKYQIASKTALANYSFFMGASNDNIEEVLKTNKSNVCGVKVFMGSSTGNMLVDEEAVLDSIFSKCDMLIATHCEDEATIRKNIEIAKAKYGEDVPIEQHPVIRDEEACYLSSSKAVELAKKHGTRLHILHISTAKELDLFRNDIPLLEKKITAEACVHHLWFDDSQYAEKGTHIKWNPAVKSKADRDAIMAAVLDNRIDVIATDHAPHTLEEKSQSYFKAPSGGPLVQHAVQSLIDQYHQGIISLETIVHKTSHALVECFGIEERGYIREGYFADLVLLDLNKPYTVSKENILYKCGWSPFEGHTFKSSIVSTFINGNLAFNDGQIIEYGNGARMTFNR